MSIFKKLKNAVTKEVIGSTLNAGRAPATLGGKSKAAAALITAAGIATAVAEYL